ncbi:hypothetical protein M514_06922 [Trichuris suis]|uniref:Uncharacterized protein n=1 Tax=Trichuris suis TaxID=68888 RepID=A0A085M4R3_9BILA|nr:hypothetical protein M513_06922 [Trichuris suis]KFD70347.1 hypothetical protein M514_06922 [Trichuris suis]
MPNDTIGKSAPTMLVPSSEIFSRVRENTFHECTTAADRRVGHPGQSSAPAAMFDILLMMLK